jgi:hypothetical protein
LKDKELNREEIASERASNMLQTSLKKKKQSSYLEFCFMVPQRINAIETHQNKNEIPGKLSESVSYRLTDTNNSNKKWQ